MRSFIAKPAAFGALTLVVALTAAFASACQPQQQGQNGQPTATYPPGYGPPPGQYPPGPQGQNPPGYPTATTPPGYPTAQPPATTTATGMNMQGVLPCTSDAVCINGKCNTQMSPPVCVWPCKSSEFDCQPGKTCHPTGVCF